MPAVTFIYRVGNSSNYLGKYVTWQISDDHEGLDLEIHSTVLTAINKYRTKKGYRLLRIHELKVGIIAYTDLDTVYCNKNESKIFDFYQFNNKSYLNGREVRVNLEQELSDEDDETE